jgi:hypothetical protein
MRPISLRGHGPLLRGRFLFAGMARSYEADFFSRAWPAPTSPVITAVA